MVGVRLVGVLVRRWWLSQKRLTRRTAVINVLIGAACLACAAFDIRLGLGSFGRAYLGYFAAICIPWGIAAAKYGGDPIPARVVRLAGDVLAWIGLIAFAIAALLRTPAEYAPLWTALVFAAVTAVGAARSVRSERRADQEVLIPR